MSELAAATPNAHRAPLPDREQYYPAFVLYGVNTLVSALVVWGLPLSNTTTAAISALATAVLGLVAGLQVRPLAVGIATPVIGALAQLGISLGWGLGQDRIQAVASVVSLSLAVITHQLVVPQAARKAGLRA